MIPQTPLCNHPHASSEDVPLASQQIATVEELYQYEAMRDEAPLTREQEQCLVIRARAGDEQAKEAICVHLMSYSSSIAGRLARTFRWAAPRIEYLDLVQTGMLAVLENFEQALQVENPIAYLIRVIRYQMFEYCRSYSSLIRTPHNSRTQLPHWNVDSLDVPLSRAEVGSSTFADVLAAPCGGEPEPDEASYQLLYAVIEQRLSHRQREMVERHYGLGCAPESIFAIGRSLAATAMHPERAGCCLHQEAITKLRKHLDGVYPLHGDAAS